MWQLTQRALQRRICLFVARPAPADRRRLGPGSSDPAAAMGVNCTGSSSYAGTAGALVRGFRE
jgi:hypothetical protein